MKRDGKDISVCTVFGHSYDSSGICRDCGDDKLLQDMKRK